MPSVMSIMSLPKGTVDPKAEILSVSMKHLGRNQPLVNIKTASVEELKEMCASGRSLNVNFQVKLAGGFVRHISLSFFDSKEFGGETTYEGRLALIMELRELDLSQFTLKMVGSTVYGPPHNRFVVLIWHFGRHQKWFIETRCRGDKEWKVSPTAHTSTAWGWNGKTFALRGDDKFTAEHAWTLALIVQVGNFIVDDDEVLVEKFDQLVNISDDEDEEAEVSA